MRPLAAVERFFERVFERPTARLFHARLQPVQLQRRLERAMESERLTSAERTLVPNRYVVHLNPADFGSFADFAVSLASELADGALTYARSRRYSLIDRPQVELRSDAAIPPGEIAISTAFADRTGGGLRPASRPGLEPPQEDRHDEAAGADLSPAAGRPSSAGVGDGTAAGEASASPVASRLPDSMSTRTMVFQVPEIRSPRARIRLWSVGGAEREIPVEGNLMTIGRARDNDLVLDDVRVSRHHARLQARSGSLVLTDLGSTNGTLVNGGRIREVVLGDGDRIEIGDSVLVVEAGRE